MKVALYVRISKRKTQTTENQVLILKKHAEIQGWEYEMFKEEESTRKTRPVKAMLLSRLRNRDFDAVCVLKIDRWARSLPELVLEVTELFDKKIPFISIRDNIDLSTATGKLQFQILCAFAEFEREIIRERTLDGIERARAQGKHIGRPHGSKDSYPRKRSGYWLRHAAPKTAEKYRTQQLIEKEERKRIKKEEKKAASYIPPKRRESVRKATTKYAKGGRLKKKKCKSCGSTENLEYHHPDYNDYKTVDVLCQGCHYMIHGRKPPGGLNKGQTIVSGGLLQNDS